MKKIWIRFSILLNVILSITSIHFYSSCANSDCLVKNYSANYVPTEMYKRARDKVDDYEWILRNVGKVENVDFLRMHWCKR